MKRLLSIFLAVGLCTMGLFTPARAAETGRLTVPNRKEVVFCTVTVNDISLTLTGQEADPALDILDRLTFTGPKPETGNGPYPHDGAGISILIEDTAEEWHLYQLDEDKVGEYHSKKDVGFYETAGVTYQLELAEGRDIQREAMSLLNEKTPDGILFTASGGNITIFSSDGLYAANAYNPTHGVEKITNELKFTPGGTPGKPLKDLDRIERNNDVWKERYELYENGVMLSLLGQCYDDSTVYFSAFYIAEEAGYQNYLRVLRESYQKEEKGPAWFLQVNPNKIIQALLYNADGKEMGRYLAQNDISDVLSSVRVKDGSALPVKETDAKLANGRRMDILFVGNIQYTISYTKDVLVIFSSDVRGGIRYILKDVGHLDDFFEQKGAYDPKITTKPNPGTGKPVIYLYPQQEQQISVKLDFMGRVDYTFPEYGNGWQVTAYPDGRIVDKNGGEYYYLFWEGVASVPWVCEKGTVVTGAETENYLRRTLAQMGLTPREYNDFITWWVPKMKDNPYNLISFSETQYDEVAKLTVSPKPDSLLRVHMVWKALEKPVTVEPQEIHGFVRDGFTVIEWGGTQIS